MKANIDASIFTVEEGAFGNVAGTLEVPLEPQVGDTISLMHPLKEGVSPPTGHARVYRIKDRILHAGAAAEKLSLMLDDITVQSVAEAQALSRYFEKGFGLFVNIYDEKNVPSDE
jgi:hypothetical protein